MEQLSVSYSCDPRSIRPMDSLNGPLDPDSSCRAAGILSVLLSDTDTETKTSDRTAGDTKVSNIPETTASEAEGDGDPLVPKSYRHVRHKISFKNAWHHRQWKVEHHVCDTCLRAAADSLGKGQKYEEQINISSRSGPQDAFVFNLKLLCKILKSCPQVMYGTKVTAECGHVAILADFKAKHSNARLREEDMDQGTFWCLFDSPSGHWEPETGWGELKHWLRDNSCVTGTLRESYSM
jgi:hypothetical protein